MKITISIKDKIGLCDKKEFISTENECLFFNIKFLDGFQRNHKYKIQITLNGETKYFSLSDDLSFYLKCDWLVENANNDLSFVLREFDEHGEIELNKNAYVIEPIFIKKLEKLDFLGTPIISKLLAETRSLQEQINALEKCVNENKQSCDEQLIELENKSNTLEMSGQANATNIATLSTAVETLKTTIFEEI